MQPGQTKAFAPKGSLVASVGLWAEKKGDWIQIHVTGLGDGQTTITNNPSSSRYHRTLFRNMRRTMMAQHCWPFGNDGAETEATSLQEFAPIQTRSGVLASDILVHERSSR